MTQRTFNTVTGVIFALVASLHGARLLWGWQAIINDWAVPGWLSVTGLLVGGALSYLAFALNRKAR